MAKKILLTGHRGYIGACLYQHLSQRFQVEIISERLEALRPKSREADLIVHCAANREVHNPSQQALYQSNELGSLRLLASLSAPTPVLFLSSRMVYASASPESGWRESDLPQPQTAYGQSKWATEQKIVASGFPYLILRLSGVFGPGIAQWGRTFPEQVLRHLIKRERVVFSRVEEIRDYLYIWDLVKQIDYLLDCPDVWPGILNLSGKPRPVQPILASLLQAFTETFGESPLICQETIAPSRQSPPLLNIEKAQSLPNLPEWSNDADVIQALVQDAWVRFGPSQSPACQ